MFGGKDFWKVDRRGGLLARAMAQRLVEAHACDEARVALEYRPGSDAPAHGEAIVDGRRIVLDCWALTGAMVVPKLQAIFTPSKSGGSKFDLKEAARWGHHGFLGELYRELPEFVASPKVTTSITRRTGHSHELGIGHWPMERGHRNAHDRITAAIASDFRFSSPAAMPARLWLRH